MYIGNQIRFYLMSVLTVTAATAQTYIESTTSKFEQWVETQRIISEEKADWAYEQEILADRRELLQTELENLQQRIKDIESGITSSDEAKVALRDEKEEIDNLLEIVRLRVINLEKRLNLLMPRLPKPLKDDLSEIITRVPENPEESDASTYARLQNILFLLKQMAKFNGNTTYKIETHTLPDGKEAQLDVLYWGLAGAYFADADRTYAGVMVPGPDGWVKREFIADAAVIGKLIDVSQGNADEEFANVPVSVQK